MTIKKMLLNYHKQAVNRICFLGLIVLSMLMAIWFSNHEEKMAVPGK